MLPNAKPGAKPIKNQSAKAADKNTANKPGPRPPNHVAAATAGKKKMKGSDVGPTACVSAALAIQPTNTATTAKPYRRQAGCARIEGFNNKVSADRMINASAWLANNSG